MSRMNSTDIGEIIVPNVDLRAPNAPQPIAVSACPQPEMIHDIRAYVGEGELVFASTPETAPKFAAYEPTRQGQIMENDWLAVIEPAFRRWGAEACVLEWDRLERKFRVKNHEHFIVQRIC